MQFIKYEFDGSYFDKSQLNPLYLRENTETIK